MKETKDEVIDVEAYIAQREKEAEEKGERKPHMRPNVNYTSFVLNEVEDVDLEYTGKNEVLEIKLLDSKGTEIKYGQKIHNNEEYTYEVIKLDEQDKNNIEKDLKNIKWCFWIPEITGFKKEQAKNFIANTNKAEHTTDFLSGFTDDTAKMKAIKQHGILYGKKEIVEKEGKKTAILKVKFSKWLDGYTIKVEAYLSGKKGEGDSVANRLLTVNPEILDAYWLNAAGRKVTNTGYKQDVYLYLKTLGLKGKTLEIQVFDKDKHPNPLPATGTDDLVEWKNNKIKIESREAIKQFKVGDIERYKEAQEDEAAESDAFMGLYDFNKARIYTLELYIHIANTAALNLKDADPQNKYGLLNLYPREEIINAFFAETETEKVQADAAEVKDQKTGKSKLPPKAEVPYYKKLNNGVIGQKVQLVAECANLEEKEVTFKIYEKEPLLVEKNKELPVLQNNTEVTEVKATVTNGYAVAEIELKHCLEHLDNKDWLDKLKNGYYDVKGKTSNLFLKVDVPDANILGAKLFSRSNPFKVISTNWHEPVDDPQIAKWNSSGHVKPQSNTFGMGRDRFHSGLDIFSLEGSNVYASLDAEVVEITKYGGYGHTITIKVDNSQEVRNRKREYTLAYTSDLKQKSLFNEKSDKIYLFHAHLEDVLVKKGDKVKAGDIIGKSGISGVTAGTYDPHLHFNMYSDKKKVTDAKNYLVNPAYYVYWKEIGDLTAADIKTQDDRKRKGKLKNANPKLSKL